MSVEVDRTGIRRQLRAYEVAFVRLRSSLAVADAAVVFEKALAGCLLDGDRPDFGALVTPSGPVTMLEEIDRPEVWEWLDLVAGGLAAAGVTGSLAAAASVKQPEVFAEGRVPTAGLRFASPGQPWQGQERWPLTAEETTVVVNHVAEWCDVAGKQWLGLNGTFWLAGSDTRQLAAPMAAAAPSAGTHLVAANGPEARVFATSWHDCGAQVVRSGLGWWEQVELCRQVLLWQPDLLLWAVVGTAEYPSLTHTLRSAPDPPVMMNRVAASGLGGTLVGAVQGIQVITGTHLARAHDLSDWQVTQVAPDRYLVEAADLEPWFTGERMDPDVYAKAEHDFGRMLVTTETADEFGLSY